MNSSLAISAQAPAREPRWLLLIHQLPPKPDYLRVKIRRRLAALGAQPLKNSVYVLPHTEEALEDFHWLRREILDAGGDATVSTAAFLEGTSDAQLEAQFRAAAGAAYSNLVASWGTVAEAPERADLARFRRQLEALAGRDFFGAPERESAERGLRTLETGTSPGGGRGDGPPRGATWVTRRDVHVDRMASAWLIRRCIDPAARFKFVAPRGYPPEPGELRFDMFDGEFTHQGDRCTFQVLAERFVPRDRAVAAIGEIVRDIDLKLEPFSREEAEGVRVTVRGIGLTHQDDAARLEAAWALFDGLYAHFKRPA